MRHPGLAYVDTSAFVKLVAAEPESAALGAELRDWPQLVASELLEIEAGRVGRRLGESAADLIQSALRGVTLIPIGPEVRQLAVDLGPPELRTLDAIHLATALSVGTALGAFFAYDQRLLAAAAASGLTTQTPG